MKEKALRLIDILEGSEVPTDTEIFEASDMIRKLVEENDRITRDLIGASLYEHDYKTLIEKLKPLSDEEIWDEVSDHLKSRIEPKHLKQFARAIEAKVRGQ